MREAGPATSIRTLLQVTFFALVLPCLPVLISTDWIWWQGWAFGVISALGFLISRLLAARRHPDIIAERARMINHADTKPWDKLLAPIVAFGMIAIMIVAGLDRRWQSPGISFPAWYSWAALVLVAGSYAFGAWALIENRFFSGVVRIQHDRGHHVVSSGPYRVVRHPGYAGGLLVYLLCPIVLDSLWAFVPAILAAAALVVRTALEDRTLRAELAGYAEYARSTRFRLLPWVW